MPRNTLIPAVLATILLAATAAPAVAEGEAPEAAGPDVSWVKGPTTAPLGKEAEIALEQGYVFLGAQDTRKLLAAMGNIVDKTEVGLVAPDSDDAAWIMVFEYHPVGYVKDDDSDKIDKQALFDSIREGTEASNEMRKKQGVPGLHVVKWFEEPNYDPASHNLQWALLAKDDEGDEVVNYNVRLLGRGGYMSVTLVDDPEKMAASRVELGKLLQGFSYKSGNTYAEFVKGDRVAELGLAALVAGGAGVAAAKLGLFGKLAKVFAKMGKGIVLVIVALVAMVKKALASLFGGREEKSSSPPAA